MKNRTWGSALLATLLLVGCGSATTSSKTTKRTTEATTNSEVAPTTTTGISNSTVSPVTQQAVGYYVDEAVEGVSYRCGVHEGNTTVDGAFIFERGENCRFSLGGITLREVNGSILIEDNITILEDNESVARMLQSFDRDGNASNGIQLNGDDLKTILEENNINHVPEDENLLGMVVDELKVRDGNFSGHVVGEEKAQEHLDRTKERLQEEGRRTQHDINETQEEEHEFFVATNEGNRTQMVDHTNRTQSQHQEQLRGEENNESHDGDNIRPEDVSMQGDHQEEQEDANRTRSEQREEGRHEGGRRG